MSAKKEKTSQELAKVNKKYVNGFLIYLDIKDSTKRKKEYDNVWFEQTKHFYYKFSNFTQNLKDVIPKANHTVDKFMGDGAFAFFKISHLGEIEKNREAAREYAGTIFDRTLEFINEIHDDDEFCGLRLKAIITYLTNIQVMGTKNKDILGRGVDFTFRLDKFADISHLTVNEMMISALTHNQNEKDRYKNFDVLEVKKKVRGWDNKDGERFYILTTAAMIENAFSSIVPSIDSQDVNIALMKHYIKRIPSNKLDEKEFLNNLSTAQK